MASQIAGSLPGCYLAPAHFPSPGSRDRKVPGLERADPLEGGSSLEKNPLPTPLPTQTRKKRQSNLQMIISPNTKITEPPMDLSFCPPHSKCRQNCLNKDKRGLCTFSTQMVESNKINIKGKLPRTCSSVAIFNKGRKKEET